MESASGSAVWVQWASISSPHVRERVARKLLQEFAQDPELSDSLQFAAAFATYLTTNGPTWTPRTSLPFDEDALAAAPSPQPRLGAGCGDNLVMQRLKRTAAQTMENVDGLVQAMESSDDAIQFFASSKGARVHEATKQVQRDVQDILILACCLTLDEAELQNPGIPRSLREKLSAACHKNFGKEDKLWSRLGNAKYQLFTPGRKFNSRKAKPNKDRNRPGGDRDVDEPAGGV